MLYLIVVGHILGMTSSPSHMGSEDFFLEVAAVVAVVLQVDHCYFLQMKMHLLMHDQEYAPTNEENKDR